MIAARTEVSAGELQPLGLPLPETSWQYEAVAAVLEAFMTLDCANVLALASPNAMFEFPMIGPGRFDPEGFSSRVQRTLPLMKNLRFFDLEVAATSESSVVATYRGAADISLTGKRYEQRYVSLFAFEDRQLTYFQENFDTAAFKSAFGLDIAWQMR